MLRQGTHSHRRERSRKHVGRTIIDFDPGTAVVQILTLGLRDTEEIVEDFRVPSKLAAVNLEGDRALSRRL
jgi:hypothetical protein